MAGRGRHQLRQSTLWVRIRVGCAGAAGACVLLAASASPLQQSVAVDRDEDVRRARVDRLFAPFDRRGSPGAAVAIYRGGQVVHSRGYGYANLEHRIPITPRSVFHVASVSKQFTAFAVALLAREGKLRLDADIRTYLPYLPDFGHTITVDDLIRHTSGLRDDLHSLAERGGANLFEQQQALNLVMRQRGLNFAPRTEALYCNVGYELLAEIVAAVSGKSYRQFVTERIFQPLGMRRTLIHERIDEVVPGRAESYVEDPSGGWRRAPLNYAIYGSTGQHMTVEDMTRWISNFRQPLVGDAALIAQLAKPGSLRDGTAVSYGFGLWRWEFAGHEAIMHTGSDAGFRAIFAYFPAEDFAVVIFCNTPVHRFNLVEAIADVYLNGGDGNVTQMPPAIDPSPAQLHAFAGHYLNPLGHMITLERAGAQLLWTSGDSVRVPVLFREDGSIDTGGERYFGYWRPATRDAQGRVTGLERVIRFLGRKPVLYSRIEQARPAEASLRRLAGDYRASELDITYRFSVEQGRLVARSLWTTAPVLFSPTLADRFDSPMGAVQFRRNAVGEPIGLLLSSESARHVPFERAPRE